MNIPKEAWETIGTGVGFFFALWGLAKLIGVFFGWKP